MLIEPDGPCGQGCPLPRDHPTTAPTARGAGTAPGSVVEGREGAAWFDSSHGQRARVAGTSRSRGSPHPKTCWGVRRNPKNCQRVRTEGCWFRRRQGARSRGQPSRQLRSRCHFVTPQAGLA